MPSSDRRPIVHLLEAALAALVRDAPEAMPHLLQAWDRSRCSRVADLVDSVHQRVLGVGQRAARDATLKTLLGGSATDAATRLSELPGGDPRVTSALIALFAGPRFLEPREHDSGITEFWEAVMSRCIAEADVRAVEPMRALAARVLLLTIDADRSARANMYTQWPLGPYLRPLLERSSAAITDGSLSEIEQSLCQQLEHALYPEIDARNTRRATVRHDRDTDCALRRAIAAEPLRDGPRRAFGRWLSDQAHPFGSYLLAALDGEPHPSPPNREWWGLPMTIAGWVVPERGLPSAIGLRFDHNPIEPSHVGAVEWATVTRLDSHCYDWPRRSELLRALVAHPVLSHLRWLNGVDPDSLVALTASPRSWSLVGLDPKSVLPQQWPSVLAALSRIPHLETVHLKCYEVDELEPLEPIFASDLEGTLSIGLRRGAPPWQRLNVLATASQFSVVQVQWGGNGGHRPMPERANPEATFMLQWTRDDKGHMSRITLWHTPSAGVFNTSEVVSLLNSLGADHLTRFELVEPIANRPHTRDLAAIQHALLRFPMLRHSALPAVSHSEPEVDHCIEALSSSAHHEVTRAVDRLAKLRAREAMEPLAMCLLTQPDATLRRSAANALAQVADSSIVPLLREAAMRTPCPSTAVVAQVLGSLRSHDAVEEVLSLLLDAPDEHTRVCAATALGWMGNPAAACAMAKLLRQSLSTDFSTHRLLRRAIVDTLGILGDPVARTAVLHVYHQGDVYDRRSAITALGTLGTPADRSLIHAHLEPDDLYPTRRPLLAAVLLDPDCLNAEAADQLAQALPVWEKSDAAYVLTHGLAQLAARLPPNLPASSLDHAIAQRCRTSKASTQARLLNFSPQASALEAWLLLIDDLSEAWAQRTSTR